MYLVISHFNRNIYIYMAEEAKRNYEEAKRNYEEAKRNYEEATRNYDAALIKYKNKKAFNQYDPNLNDYLEDVGELHRVRDLAERYEQARKRLKDFAKQNLDESTKALSRSKSFRNAAAPAEKKEAAAPAEAKNAAETAAAAQQPNPDLLSKKKESSSVIVTRLQGLNITPLEDLKITRYGGFSKKKRFNTRKLRRGSRQKTKNKKIKKRKTKRNY